MEQLQAMPILVDAIAHRSDEEMLAKIEQNDLNNRQLSRQLVQTEVQLFEGAMKLQLEALAFAGEHVSEWSKADQVIVAMACRVFNHLRSAAELLLLGYWAEATVVERSAFEAMTREWYFFKYPNEAKKWFRGKRKGQVYQRTVNQALGAIDGKETSKILKKHYDHLSKHSHPNREAINLQTWDGEEAIGRKGFLGGYVNTEYFPIQFRGFLLTVNAATEMLGIVGLHKATDTWDKECRKLAKAIFTLASHSVREV